MHATDPISVWKTKGQGERVRKEWKNKSKRAAMISLLRKKIRGKVAHLDAESKHAKADHAAYANGYQNLRRKLDPYTTTERPPATEDVPPDGVRVRGGHDWAVGFGPLHLIVDEDDKELSEDEFVSRILKCNLDKFGRLRKNLARRGILNPITAVQVLMRHLSLHVPNVVNALYADCFQYLKDRLRGEFPGAPIEVAFHVATGRPHWEWIVPKYSRAGKLVRPDLNWDGPKRSTQHATLFALYGRSGRAPMLNSRIEIELYQMILERYRRAEREWGLRRLSETELLEAEIFFLEVQEASLQDGMKSRSPSRTRKAAAELSRNSLKLRRYRTELARIRGAVASKSDAIEGFSSPFIHRERERVLQPSSAAVRPEKYEGYLKQRSVLLSILCARPGEVVATPQDMDSLKELLNFDVMREEMAGGITALATQIFRNDSEILAAAVQHAESHVRFRDRIEKTKRAKAGLATKPQSPRR